MTLLLVILVLATILGGPIAVCIFRASTQIEGLTSRARMLLILLPPFCVVIPAICYILLMTTTTYHLPQHIGEGSTNQKVRGDQTAITFTAGTLFLITYGLTLLTTVKCFGNIKIPEDPDTLE